MTWEEAADEYALAIDDRDFNNPVVIEQAKVALANLEPFLEDGKIPHHVHMRIKEVITNGKPSS